MTFAFRHDPGATRVGVAFTSRHGGVTPGTMGSLNLGRSDVDDPANVAENFRIVRDAISVDTLVVTHQVHGTDVLDADAVAPDWRPGSELGSRTGVPLRVADALVATTSGLALAVRIADCVPVILADPAAGVVAAAHAGRVGLAAGVLEATVQAMRDRGATAIEAWVGPHVCGRCYEVPQQMADDVAQRIPATRATTTWGTPSLDLGAGCRQVLEHLDIRVTRVDGCTREDHDLHSHRRDGASSGRMAGIVWLARDEPRGPSGDRP